MLDFIDPLIHPETALLRLLVAGLLGGLIGVERERSEVDAREQFAGVRTFPMFAALGAVLALVSGALGAIVIVGFLGVAALVVVSYLASSRTGDVGATTETAALAAYWIGAIAGAGALLLAGALGIGLTVLLASKQRLEAFPRALAPAELQAALTLAVIAAVILPILPDAGYGPWGVWNPRSLWAMVVIVCGLSFVAFVAMRLWGPSRGLYLSGILGGLVSSTAATVSFAGRARESPAHGRAFAVAAGLASLVMLARIGLLAVIAGPDVFPRLAVILAASGAGGTIALLALARRARPSGEAVPALTNPFRLFQAVKFALLYGVVLLAVAAAARYLGGWGVAAASIVAGLTDVDAITLSVAGMARDGTLTSDSAANAIAAAALSNTAAKAAYAWWLGEPRFRRAVLVALGTAFAAGALALGIMAMAPAVE